MDMFVFALQPMALAQPFVINQGQAEGRDREIEQITPRLDFYVQQI